VGRGHRRWSWGAILSLAVGCRSVDHEVAERPAGALRPPSGPLRNLPPHPAGPAVSQLRLATSGDGLAWEREDRTVVERADAPTCATVAGRLWVFFVLWEDRDGALRDTTVAAWTEDLDTWSLAEVEVGGIPADYRSGVADPCLLADAVPGSPSPHRLYFVLGGAGTRVFAARSADLLHWVIEEGPGPDGSVHASPTGSVRDPAAVRLDDGGFWHYAGGDPRRGTHRATSRDGLHLDPLPPRHLLDGHALRLKPSNGQVVDGQPVFWAFPADQGGRVADRILRLDRVGTGFEVTSPPALEATGDEPVIRDAAVCPHPAGDGLVMVYATSMPDAPPPPR